MVGDTVKKYRDLLSVGLLAVASLYVISGISLLSKSREDSFLDFSGRAAQTSYLFTHPFVVVSLAVAVALAVGFGEASANARGVVIAALIVGGIAILLGVVTWLSAFGYDGVGFGGVVVAGKVVAILLGLAQLIAMALTLFFAVVVLQALPKRVRQPQGWGQGAPGYGPQWGQPDPGQWGGQHAAGQQWGQHAPQQQAWTPPPPQQQWGQHAPQQPWGPPPAEPVQPGWGHQQPEPPIWGQPQPEQTWGQPPAEAAPQGWGQPPAEPSNWNQPEQSAWSQPAEPAAEQQTWEPSAAEPAAEQQAWEQPATDPVEETTVSEPIDDSAEAGREDTSDDEASTGSESGEGQQDGWWQRPSS